MEEIIKIPSMPWMLSGLLLSPRSISWPSGMDCFPTSGNSLVRVYMCCPCAFVTLLPIASSKTPKCSKCLKSWSCNMQCDSMRPGTGSTSKTSLSLHTNPRSSSANFLNPSASSTKRPKSTEGQTSCPSQQQPQQHLLSTLMP